MSIYLTRRTQYPIPIFCFHAPYPVPILNSSHSLVEIHPGEMDSLIDTTAGSQYNTHG